MAKPLPTSTPIILDGLLRSAVALQIAVYEFRDSQIDDTEALRGVESATKSIERFTRALRNTF